MKVAMAGYQAISMTHGGPLTQVLMTASHLRAHGVEADLFDPWKPFDRGTADLVHLFGANIGTFHLAREARRLGIPLMVSPIIYSRHSPSFLRAGLGLTRLVRAFAPGTWSDYGLAADICGWAEGVLPNSEAEAELVAGGFGIPRERMRVIPNGVEERFAAGDPERFAGRYGVRDFILTVTHVGHHRKNVLRLLQALGSIDHPSVVIGKVTLDREGELCRAEAARHKQILLLDRVDHGSDLLASAYAACRVFVLPSLFETPGIAALEAALAGANIVITPHGGPREYFGDMADYVEPASVSSIREGISRALARPRTDRLREHIRADYLWNRVAELTAAAYRELTGPSTKRGHE